MTDSISNNPSAETTVRVSSGPTPCTLWATAALLVGGAIGCVAALSLSRGPAQAVPPAILGGPTVSCDRAVQFTDDPIEPFELANQFFGYPAAESHQLGSRGTDGDPESQRRFASIPLIVRADVDLVLEIGPDSSQLAQLKWGIEGEPALVQRIEPCTPPTGAGEWAILTGGLWTLEPACVRLLAHTPTGSTEFLIPLGATCQT